MRRSVLAGLTAVGALGLLATTAAAAPSSAHLARDATGIFWFMHVSDLHTSCQWDPTDESKNIAFALGPAVQVIKPWFLVATGDLVDGSPNGLPTLGQSQQEWDEYKALYQAAGMTPDFYFDLPGNHDGYGDIGYHYYLANSLHGSTRHTTYVSWNVDTPLGTYYFFGFSSAGVGSGAISEDPKFLDDQVAAFQDGLIQNADAQLVFVLAHHRITQPANSAPVIDALSGVGGGFYIHGHVHEYDEYTDGDPSIVACEVDSLGQKETNNIAVGAVDHNAFIYRVTSTKTPWPLVMITAPVSATLRNGEPNPYAYTVCNERKDTPVRALVFGDGPTTAVAVQIDTLPAKAMTEQQPNVWAAEVDTTPLSAGLHDVTVSVTVGGKAGFDKVVAQFVDGPCDPLPDDSPQPDAGTDGGLDDAGDGGDSGGAAGAGGSDAGAGGAGGSGAAGSGGAASSGGAAGQAGATPSGQNAPAPVASDGGCSCTTPSQRMPPSRWWMTVLLGAAMLLRRRSR